MDIRYYQDQVSNKEKEIADLQKKFADESKREFDKQKQIDTVNRSITKNTSLSTIQSKIKQIEGYQKNILDIQQKKAAIQKSIATKTQELGRKKTDLLKKEEQNRKKIEKEQLEFQEKLQNDIIEQTGLLSQLIQQNYSEANYLSENSENYKKQYDFFICHATEDKEDFVQPLAEAIENAGFRVWYDKFSLTFGDSLRKSIDEGLANSRYGIVILSSYFFKKKWTEYELNGLVAREMRGHKVILPIWHKITIDEILSYSPTLADKVALDTSRDSIEEIVEQLKKLLSCHSTNATD